MKPFFAYIRVSTQRQGERGVSLQEQRAAIERYADREGITISRWFEERETAAKQGRPVFNDLLRRLRRGEAGGVLIHKIDRSARNLRDFSDVEDVADQGVQVHFTQEGLELSSTGDRMAAEMQAVVAAHYVRNLREEAKKGIYGRFKQGILPLPAPLGYLDRGAGKPKEIDPEKGPLVRLAFELYATGRYSLVELLVELARRGLKNRRGGRVSTNGIAKTLRNPFYIGLLRIQKTGEILPGAHEPLITQKLFLQVQEALDGKLPARPTRHDFLFRRLLTCRNCDYSLIGEIQKGRVYYRCHTRGCPTTTIREDEAEQSFRETIAPLCLTPVETQLLSTILSSVREEWHDGASKIRRDAALKDADAGTRLARLTDAYLDGTLEKPLFLERKAALLLEREGLKEHMVELDRNPTSALDDVARFLELAGSAPLLYESASKEERREILLLMTSNRSVYERNAEFTLVPAARILAERRSVTTGGPHRYRPRTLKLLLNQLIEWFTVNPGPHITESIQPPSKSTDSMPGSKPRFLPA